MLDTIPGAERFDLDAGTLCLDFANTLDFRYDEQPKESIGSYDDLIAFAGATGVIDAAQFQRLAALAQEHPDAAEATRADALALRETLFQVFAAVAAGGLPPQPGLDALTPGPRRVYARGGLRVEGGRVVWGWEDVDPADPVALERPLWPVVRDAFDLLRYGDVSRVRECAAHDCGWLFLDTSRNRSRRWCSMQTCGNRAKVSHFRERQRG